MTIILCCCFVIALVMWMAGSEYAFVPVVFGGACMMARIVYRVIVEIWLDKKLKK